jgi:hypothetical protein
MQNPNFTQPNHMPAGDKVCLKLLVQSPQSSLDAIALDGSARFPLCRKPDARRRVRARKNEKDQISVPHRSPLLKNLSKSLATLQAFKLRLQP